MSWLYHVGAIMTVGVNFEQVFRLQGILVCASVARSAGDIHHKHLPGVRMRIITLLLHETVK